ncbi:hypothetical protein [Paenibacillus polymyxa]|uniref:hypothetical protein n=1 Tax=Paenibacillus polymyxa TaxID=1406 RepID=UPI002AB4E6E8|nr:hypothetical protein [Paenibacillus polymyxa]MDY8026142.1 hypothetical protein [Paenibacillus polymyxa]
MNISHWQGQDTLNLNEEEWLALFQDKEIFKDIGLKMVAFVHGQPNFQSSATEIGEALGGGSQQQVTAWNRAISKRIYKKLSKTPPFNYHGERRYWNVLFDGDTEQEFDELGRFIWQLRPPLIAAFEQLRAYKDITL